MVVEAVEAVQVEAVDVVVALTQAASLQEVEVGIAVDIEEIADVVLLLIDLAHAEKKMLFSMILFPGWGVGKRTIGLWHDTLA